MSRYVFAFLFGLALAGVTAAFLPTNALGAGWVFLIDVVLTGGFAGFNGRQRFREDRVRARIRV